MVSDPATKLPEGGDKKKQVEHEVRDMVNAITRRVFADHASGGEGELEDGDNDGIRIITLAGTNTGATMRTELDEKHGNANPNEVPFPDANKYEYDEFGTTYVNSNFQAVNNSIMLGSNYSTNDPGVHLEISDVYDDHDRYGIKYSKHGKKGKKKEKEKKESASSSSETSSKKKSKKFWSDSDV